MKKIVIIFMFFTTCFSSHQLYTKECKQTKSNETITYTVIVQGNGPFPVDGQAIAIHYTGWVDTNGELSTKIDSSKDRGIPIKCILGRNILSRWEPIIRRMNVGSVYRLFIPSALGYGSRGIPNLVPKDANLIFDIELLEVIPT